MIMRNNYRLVGLILLVFAVAVFLYGKSTSDRSYLDAFVTSDGLRVETKGDVANQANIRELNQARSALATNDLELSRDLYKSIIEKTPDEFAALHGLGTVYYYLDRLEESRFNYLKAIEFNGMLYQAYAGVAAVEQKLMDYSAAIIWFTKAININSTYTTALYGRAQCYIALKEYELAVNDLRDVIQLNSDTALSKRSKVILARLKRENLIG